MVIRMKMSLTGKLLAVLLALVLLFGMVPASAAGPAADTEDLPAVPLASGSELVEVEFSDGDAESLKECLEIDGDYLINITKDMSARIG